MDRNTRLGLDFYLEQQCVFAGIALNDLIEEAKKDPMTQSIDRMWYSIHGFLTAVANINKTFDPPKGDSGRGEELRTAYSIDAQNPLMSRNMKNLRHAMEHFDERFENWAREHQGRGFSAFSVKIGRVPVVSGDSDHFTLYIPSLTLTYLGTEVELEPLHQEAKELIPRIRNHYMGLMRPSHPDKVLD